MNPSQQPELPLALYMTWTCPYCTRVLKTIGTLDLQVELLDITADETARDALAKQIGRTVVPVLRVGDADNVEWIRESSLIIHRLRAMGGAPSRLPAAIALAAERIGPVALGCVLAGLLSGSEALQWSLTITGALLLVLRTVVRRL